MQVQKEWKKKRLTYYRRGCISHKIMSFDFHGLWALHPAQYMFYDRCLVWVCNSTSPCVPKRIHLQPSEIDHCCDSQVSQLVGLLVASHLWNFTWHLLVPRKLILKRGDIQVCSRSQPFRPCVWSVCCFNHRDLPSTSEEQPRAVTIVCKIWGVSWTALTKQLKRGFLMTDVGGFIRSYLMRIFHLNYLWIHRFTCIIHFFR